MSGTSGTFSTLPDYPYQPSPVKTRKSVALYLLDDFSCFLSPTVVFFQNFFQEYHQGVKQLNNLAQQNVRPDLNPNCLQWLSAVNASKQRLNTLVKDQSPELSKFKT